jgi:hypothetical protein
MKLKISHIFLVSEIADKMQLEIPTPPAVKTPETMQAYGLEVMNAVLKKAYKAKEPLIKLLAGVIEKSEAEIEEQPLEESFKNLVALFNAEGFMDFFKSPGRLNSDGPIEK